MPESHEFYFLRHGETAANLAGRLQGQTDSPLTDRGRRQARRLAQQWGHFGINFDAIISSPQHRALETAEIFRNILHVPAPIETDPIWMERSFGALEGEQIDALAKRQPAVDYFHPYSAFEGAGETQTDLYVRALSGVQKAVQRKPGCYLIVSHGALLSRVFFALLGITPVGHQTSLTFRIENTGYLHALYDNTRKRWTILTLTNPAEFRDNLEES